jgi:hypothetical protein
MPKIAVKVDGETVAIIPEGKLQGYCVDQIKSNLMYDAGELEIDSNNVSEEEVK